MLETLTIKNYALISDIHIKFSSGFNILTGETGAGKSILIGALSLLLGEKGDTSKIRTGCEQASVTATILVESDSLRRWLEEHEMTCEDGILLVRRSLQRTGRGTIRIQHEPVTRKLLRDLSSLLFDLHGQHEHQSLLQPAVQRKMLDRYGDLEQKVSAFSDLFHEFLAVQEAAEVSKRNERESIRERDMLSYAIEEIEALHIERGEDEALEKELAILSQHERLLSDIGQVKGRLDLTNGSLSGIAESEQYLEDAVEIDESLQSLTDRLHSVRYELEDVLEEVRHYADSVAFSSDRLEQVQERLLSIRQVKKKYGDTIDEVLTYRDNAAVKLDRIDHQDEDKKQLSDRLVQLQKEVKLRSAEITSARIATAHRLEPLIMGHMDRLGMPHAKFIVRISPKQNSDGIFSCTANGSDAVEFLISANLGEPEKTIRQTASGGELSRIMLALKTVFSEEEQIETLIFDEIDLSLIHI